ncbi:MAG TPA: type II secretion system minor pseudopilin GspK [Burkholderiales bacterium]|nr:type II secretion system minor pseudopilin GspK [Burkholderiales bacterium]
MSAGQRGVAIVLAMGVVALAAMAATAIMITQSTWWRQSELAAAHVQAQTLVQASVDWSRAMLSDDRRLSNIDHLGEPWALRLPPMSVESGELAGDIADQQGLFNLNNLVKSGKVDLAQLAHLQSLLSMLGLPTALAGALADWLDADSEPQPQGGAEDEFYLALQPPYLAANRPLTDLAELALVRGFDDDVRARLRPFVSALPAFTAVNVNTAPPEVLAAIVEGLGLDGARDLVAKRSRAYFRDRTDLLRQLPNGVLVATEDISFSSDYFMATLRATIGGAQARCVALLARGNSGGWPAIVWRKVL